MTKGGKREGAGRPTKYPTKTKDFTLSWPPLAIIEAKEKASREEKSLSEYILLRIFGRKFHK